MTEYGKIPTRKRDNEQDFSYRGMTEYGKIPARKVYFASLLIFSILAIAYFLPGDLLSGFLPSGVVRFRIAYPVAVLFLGGLLAGLDLRFALAFLFSCTGDAFGAGGSFIGQMGFFALAHVMLIWGFIKGLRVVSTGSTTARGKVVSTGSTTAEERLLSLSKHCERVGVGSTSGDRATWFRQDQQPQGQSQPPRRERVWIGGGLAAVAAVFILACAIVLPSIEDSVLVWGCGIYALLICTMASLAMLQHSPLFALGALLFVISDLILSWDRFVGSVACEKYLIMVPYYIGQALLWLGAVSKNTTFAHGNSEP
jgi:hypothetical protein